MPLYDFRCRTCETVFELRRSMAEADAPATCPDGHEGAVRLLPVFAAIGSAPKGSGPSPASEGGPSAGPCGGACACYPG